MKGIPPKNSCREMGARRICERLRQAGYRALLAGGCVRDRCRGVLPKDYDIATNARSEQVQTLFPKTVPLGEKFGTVLVVSPEGEYEVTTFRTDGPYLNGRRPVSVIFTDEVQDARRRDFTVNALFLDPETDQVLDYVGGLDDLRAGIIRTVGDPEARFGEDRLRLLRAVRFAARMEYRIEARAWRAMKRMASYVAGPSAERIRQEILGMLRSGRAGRAFRLLDEAGFLEALFPEITAMKGVAQPPEFHPEGDVFAHTMLALDQLPEGVSPTLAMATLLHDVGKPLTRTEEDRIRFHYHEKVGARISEAICERLRFSREDTERVAWLVGRHMQLAAFMQMREHRRRRLVRESAFEELLELCRIDCLASHGDLDLVSRARAYADQLTPDQIRPAPLLTGHDLLALGYAAGPLFRKILHDIESRQLENAVHTREEALEYLRRAWPRQ